MAKIICEVTLTLTFHHKYLISSSLSPIGHLFLKVFLRYHIYKNEAESLTLMVQSKEMV